MNDLCRIQVETGTPDEHGTPYNPAGGTWECSLLSEHIGPHQAYDGHNLSKHMFYQWGDDQYVIHEELELE